MNLIDVLDRRLTGVFKYEDGYSSQGYCRIDYYDDLYVVWTFSGDLDLLYSYSSWKTFIETQRRTSEGETLVPLYTDNMFIEDIKKL